MVDVRPVFESVSLRCATIFLSSPYFSSHNVEVVLSEEDGRSLSPRSLSGCFSQHLPRLKEQDKNHSLSSSCSFSNRLCDRKHEVRCCYNKCFLNPSRSVCRHLHSLVPIVNIKERCIEIAVSRSELENQSK